MDISFALVLRTENAAGAIAESQKNISADLLGNGGHTYCFNLLTAW